LQILFAISPAFRIIFTVVVVHHLHAAKLQTLPIKRLKIVSNMRVPSSQQANKRR